ncbi:hypothetical protein ACFYOD_37450 [Streptomyces sp. NPDC006703]|uniref:hypothetical protein n=1 Tax=Streptomyces sp. NPDC006703 TaxID=3364759 RepID=UPI0036C19424
MSIKQHPGGEHVDIDQLTASNINDDQLDAIRTELKHYRNQGTPAPQTQQNLKRDAPRQESNEA